MLRSDSHVARDVYSKSTEVYNIICPSIKEFSILILQVWISFYHDASIRTDLLMCFLCW